MILLALVLASVQALAYPWNIRHGYPGCAQCHADPSGSGLLTEYGRGQSEILLRTPWKDRPEDWEPGPVKDFLFGAVDLPDWLLARFASRSLLIPQPGNFRFIQMQTDLALQARAGPARAYASLGWAGERAYGAWLTSNTEGGNAISREHWVALDVGKPIVVRAGRMALPFGLRSEEHILYTRSFTRTDINASQQHGAAVALNTGPWRAEVMGIAGNLQVSPGDFRERGVAGYVAWSPSTTSEVGLTSLWAHADLDVDRLLPRTRSASGLFARATPLHDVVVLAEADLLTEDSPGTGSTGFVQVDWEPVQGVHGKLTGEWLDDPLVPALPASTGAWLSGLWFFAPHADVRLDALYRQVSTGAGVIPVPMGLVQLHFTL